MVSLIRTAYALVGLLLVPVWAQGVPLQPPPPKPKAEKKAEESKKEESEEKPAPAEEPKDDGTKEAAAGSGSSDVESGGDTSDPIDITKAPKEEVKVLKPRDVPNELLRLKTKADIKAEVTVLPLHGRSVTVKGVIRNGKLIERFKGRSFVPQKDIEHPQCGVRLWWVEGSAGWIFLRYAQVQKIALTGQLTPEERRKILEALRAKPKPESDKPKQVDPGQELEKLSPDELEAYLLSQYPADDGWNHKRLRGLKRKQIIEEKPLTRSESIFVKYFPILIKARLKELKRQTDKTQFEPGSQDEPGSDSGEPGSGESKPDDDAGDDG